MSVPGERETERLTEPATGAGPDGETQDFPAGPTTAHEPHTDGAAPPRHADTEAGSPTPDGQETGAFEPGRATRHALTATASRERGTVTAHPGEPTDGFLTTEPAPRPAAAGRGDGRPVIAGYEVLGVLGRGGMGIVYKARQTGLDRLVALKMILAGANARPSDVARFEAEARAVAQIDHPNIVQIFEVGEHEGLPYFSLEYVDGGSLAQKIGGKPRPVGEAARLVEALARAMAVAHGKGVIHRDLKPANVLLAADGTPKVTDFGLVKRLEDDSGQTQSGSILGTPSYMAPEQARGETKQVGPAADQYALGAILYELLTGRPPFQGASVLDTLEMVRTKEPVPPSQLQPKVPRDLETVCLKCLQKEPDRRYPDAAALAEDLRRFSAGEPIAARPVSDAERLWRWCRRNPRVAVLSAAVALLLVAVTTVSAAAAVTVSGKNSELRAANKTAEKRREAAVKAARAANKQNSDSVASELALIELLEGKLRNTPGIQEVRGQVLEVATKNLDAAATAMTDLRREVGWDLASEESNWRNLARARQRLGDFNLSLNRYQDAMKQFRGMDANVETLAAAAPDDLAAQYRLARSKRHLGFVSLNRLADSDTALRYFRRALEINRACLAKDPGNDNAKAELANTLGQTAIAEKQLGHLEPALDLFREEIPLRESLSPARANHPEMRRELAGLFEQLGDLHVRTGKKDEGRQYYEQSAGLRERLAAERPDFWPDLYNLAMSYNNAGFLLFPQGRDPAGARPFHRAALDILAKRVESDPSNLETKGTLAKTSYYEATCALHSGDAAGARAGYGRCLEIYKELANDPKAKASQVDLMLALARCGEHAEADRMATTLVATPPRDENLYFQAACGHALAAGAAAGDAALVRRYTDAAVDCLRKVKERGWADVVSLDIDPDLEPIRADAKFQALLAEFRQQGKAKP